VRTPTKTALGQVRSLGLVPELIATQTKSGLAKDVVTYPAASYGGRSGCWPRPRTIEVGGTVG
jgi:hypothetical protein